MMTNNDQMMPFKCYESSSTREQEAQQLLTQLALRYDQ